jgi:hypothetical protein
MPSASSLDLPVPRIIGLGIGLWAIHLCERLAPAVLRLVGRTRAEHFVHRATIILMASSFHALGAELSRVAERSASPR